MRSPDAQRDLNATLGILGIFALGVFLTWFVIVPLALPLPEHPVNRKVATTILQTAATIVMPYVWASRRLGMSPRDLGLNLKSLGRSTLLGCGLYALALAAFIHCSKDPLIYEHPIRFVGSGNAFVLVLIMSVHAASTDIATRGFILLSLARHSRVWFAILMQNLVWFVGHVYEIELLRSCLGLPAAVGLFLTLGVLGDMVALRTRNVVGLALAHVMLNVVMTLFIRQL